MGVVKPVKVRNIDEDTIIKDVFNKENILGKINYERKQNLKSLKESIISNDNQEKVLSATMDWKIPVIVILLVFLAGFFFRDHTMNDNIENIQAQNKNIFIQNRNIERAEDSISGSLASIEKSKTVLETKYNITYK